MIYPGKFKFLYSSSKGGIPVRQINRRFDVFPMRSEDLLRLSSVRTFVMLDDKIFSFYVLPSTECRN